MLGSVNSYGLQACGWLSRGLVLSGRALLHVWQKQKSVLRKTGVWLSQPSRGAPQEDPLLPYWLVTNRQHGGPVLKDLDYSPFTHYGLRDLREVIAEVEGVTVVVYQGVLEWIRDADGRMREIHELNLEHLGARVVGIVPEAETGARRRATVIFISSRPLLKKFLPKD